MLMVEDYQLRLFTIVFTLVSLLSVASTEQPTSIIYYIGRVLLSVISVFFLAITCGELIARNVNRIKQRN